MNFTPGTLTLLFYVFLLEWYRSSPLRQQFLDQVETESFQLRLETNLQERIQHRWPSYPSWISWIYCRSQSTYKLLCFYRLAKKNMSFALFTYELGLFNKGIIEMSLHPYLCSRLHVLILHICEKSLSYRQYYIASNEVLQVNIKAMNFVI